MLEPKGESKPAQGQTLSLRGRSLLCHLDANDVADENRERDPYESETGKPGLRQRFVKEEDRREELKGRRKVLKETERRKR